MNLFNEIKFTEPHQTILSFENHETYLLNFKNNPTLN